MLVQHVPPSAPPPQSFLSGNSTSGNDVSPSLFLITLLAVIFFVSGLLHLLIRFLILRPSESEPEDLANVTALQGQLQQLFHLHDAGVDQSLIDSLPVFHYKSIMGANDDPFDCAVCLCEFEVEDKLRLLPNCSHAFHVECIDTWLLAHSTCPLCRASLLLDFSEIDTRSSPPSVNVHEPGVQSSTGTVPDGESGVERSNSNLGISVDGEIPGKEEADSGEKVVAVKLGKLRSVDGIEGYSDNGNVDSRRCFSMGSFEYVMDENSLLQVPIRRIPLKKQSRKKNRMPSTSGRRMAMSECDCESRREFNGFETMFNNGSRAVVKKTSKKESFSISKIWLRGKRDKQNNPGVGSSRRAFSFRFPQHQNSLRVKNGSSNTIDNNGNNGIGCDEENQSWHSLDLEAKTPSFARRSVVWIAGRQNKVVHSSSFSTPDV